MADAAFAKLLFLQAKVVRDPDRQDDISIGRGDGGIFDRAKLAADEVFAFSNDRLIPFQPNGAPIVIDLFEDRTKIGAARISASELGLGGALYELTYKVI